MSHVHRLICTECGTGLWIDQMIMSIPCPLCQEGVLKRIKHRNATLDKYVSPPKRSNGEYYAKYRNLRLNEDEVDALFSFLSGKTSLSKIEEILLERIHKVFVNRRIDSRYLGRQRKGNKHWENILYSDNG